MRTTYVNRCDECNTILASSWDILGIECPCGKILCKLCYDTIHFNHNEHLNNPWR